jgi:YVTN family beta-propeller protein
VRRLAALFLPGLLLASAASIGAASPEPAAPRNPGPPRDMLVVLNKSDNTASVLDATTGKSLATLPTGVGPHEVTILPGGRVAVVSNYGTREAPGRSLTLIDLAKLANAGTIILPEGARPHGSAAVSAEKLLVTAEGRKELLVVEPLARRLTSTIPIGKEVSHMVVVSPDGKRAFVANIGSGSVTVVDVDAGSVLTDIPTGAGAEGIDIRPGGAEVWVANREANTISVIDTSRAAVTATIPAAEFPIRVKFTPDGRRALVSCAKSGDVIVFDAAARKEIRRISMDREAVPGSETRLFSTRFGKSPTPVGILVSADGKRAWVASTNADVVSEIDLQKMEVVRRLTAGKEPDGLAGAFRAR